MKNTKKTTINTIIFGLMIITLGNSFFSVESSSASSPAVFIYDKIILEKKLQDKAEERFNFLYSNQEVLRQMKCDFTEFKHSNEQHNEIVKQFNEQFSFPINGLNTNIERPVPCLRISTDLLTIASVNGKFTLTINNETFDISISDIEKLMEDFPSINFKFQKNNIPRYVFYLGNTIQKTLKIMITICTGAYDKYKEEDILKSSQVARLTDELFKEIALLPIKEFRVNLDKVDKIREIFDEEGNIFINPQSEKIQKLTPTLAQINYNNANKKKFNEFINTLLNKTTS